jgi:hypothetical protein
MEFIAFCIAKKEKEMNSVGIGLDYIGPVAARKTFFCPPTP